MNNDHDRLSSADAPMRVRNAHPRAENAPMRVQNAPLRVPSLFPTRTCACVLWLLALLSAATFALAKPVRFRVASAETDYAALDPEPEPQPHFVPAATSRETLKPRHFSRSE